jgi:type IV secretory pathway protease TraF
MNRRPYKKIAVITAAALLLPLVTLFIKEPLVFINASRSLPRGIYIKSPRPVRENDFVVINTGNLAFSNNLPDTAILKTAAYLHNEYIAIDDSFLIINGNIYIRKYRATGVHYNAPLRDGECILLGSHERSFDSRYFGPVRLSDCTRVRPLFTEGPP